MDTKTVLTNNYVKKAVDSTAKLDRLEEQVANLTINVANEMVGLAKDNEAETVRDAIPSGFTKLSEIDYNFMATNPNKIKLKTESIAYTNGYRITIPTETIIDIDTPPEKEPREDLVFLEAWKDFNFGKTGKLKWRIRSVSNASFTTSLQSIDGIGFELLNGLFTSACMIQGGNNEPLVLTSSSVNGTEITNKCFTTYSYRQLTGAKLPYQEDTGLFLGGDGTDSSKNLLKTSDGYVYAIPMFRVYRRPSCGYMATNEYNVISPLSNPIDTRKITSQEKVASSLDNIEATVEGKSLVNLMQNSSFKKLSTLYPNQAEGYGQAGAGTSIASITKDGAIGGTYTQKIKVTSGVKGLMKHTQVLVGRKYLFSVYIKTETNTLLNLGNSLYGGNYGIIGMNPSTVMTRYSHIFDSISENFYFYYTSGKDSYVNGIMLYDLTEIYGIGKEPTDITQLERELPYVDEMQSSKPIAIKSIGKNLISLEFIRDNINYQGSYITIVNGKRALYFPSFPNTNAVNLSRLVKQDTQYTLKLNVEATNGSFVGHIIHTDGSSVAITSSNNNTQTSLPSKTLKQLNFFYSGSPTNLIIYEEGTQLEEGATATIFENYKESQIILPSNLIDSSKGLPNGVKDTVDLVNKKLTQRLGKWVLDGSEDWAFSDTGLVDTILFKSALFNNAKISTLAYTNTFPYDIKNYGSGVDLECCYINISGNILIKINKSKLSTLDPTGLKEWLKDNPTTVYYELVTPIEHDISDLVKGRLYVNPENTTFQVDQVSQKEVIPVAVPNLATNGDFSNGVTGWTTMSISNVVTSANEISFIPTNIYGGLKQGTVIAGNKYYLQASIKASSTTVRLFIRNGGNGVNHSGSGKYEKISLVSSSSGQTNSNAFSVEEFGNEFSSISVRKFFAVDLTTMFGVGNEPSKEWCDKYLEFGTNYKVELPKGNKVLAIERDNKDLFKGVQGNIGVIPSTKYREGIYNVYYQEPEETHVSPDVTIKVGTKKLELKDNGTIGSLDLTNEVGYKKHSNGGMNYYSIIGSYTFSATQPGNFVDLVVNSVDYINVNVGDVLSANGNFGLKVINKKDNNTITLLSIGTGAVGTFNGSYKLITSYRPDLLFSNIVNKDDVTNLRHQVSLTGFDYQGLLEQSFNSLLQGEDLN